MSIGIFKPGKGEYGNDKTKVTKEDIFLIKTVGEVDSVPPTILNTVDHFIYGNGAAWISDFVFEVTEHKFTLKGVEHIALRQELTLEDAHATLDRKDLIIATLSPNGEPRFEVLTGVPAANPIKRTVEYGLQLEVTVIDVDANTTEPANISTLLVYDENVEFTTSNVGTSVDFDATTNPYTGTKCIEVIDFVAGDSIKFVSGSTFLPLDYDLLQLPISSIGAWDLGQFLKISLYNGATKVSLDVHIGGDVDGPYSFNSGYPDWFLKSIPMSAFGVFSNTADTLLIEKLGTSGNQNFRLDLIRFQSGITVPSLGEKTKLSEFINDGNGDINKPFITEDDVGGIAHLEFDDTDKTVWNNGKGNISGNISFGENALKSNTTGNFNNSFGRDTLQNNTEGDNNTAMGNGSLGANTTGNNNTSIGVSVLQSNTEGHSNTAVGISSLQNNTEGFLNTAIGRLSLLLNITGERNTALGYSALNTNTIGNDNTAIGNGADVGSNNLTNATAIGNGAIVSASNTVVIGNASIIETYLKGVLSIGITTDYVDNAAAITGGLAVGQVYRTGDVLKIVH